MPRTWPPALSRPLALLMLATSIASCAGGQPPAQEPVARVIPEPPKAMFAQEPPPVARPGGNPKLYADEARDTIDRLNMKLGQSEAWINQQRAIWGRR